MAGNVGAVRDFYAAHAGIPRTQIAHYVTVIEDPEGNLAAISTCCDGTADAARMLAGAIAAVTGKVTLAPESDGVIVGRSDLERILSHGKTPADVLARLRSALGEETG